MYILKKLRIAPRMALGFGSVLSLLLLVVVIASARFGAIDEAADVLMNDAWAKADAVRNLDAATRANGTRTLELVMTSDAGRQAELRERIRVNRSSATAAIETLQRLVKRPEARQALGEIVALRARYVESFQNVDADIAAGRLEAATARCRTETIPLLDRLQSQTKVLAKLQDEIAADAAGAMRSSVRSGRSLVLGLGLGALAVGVAFAWSLARSVTRPIAQALGIASRIASGDLTARVTRETDDEVGDLLDALDRMAVALSSVVGTVRGNADGVATASSQIAQGNLDLSQRTEEQASALQQTAASMEQLNSAVCQNAANSRQANELAVDAARIATEGGRAVAGVVTTMQSVQAGAERVGDIIGTVDSIAFQTNILALNAAVEAARAGEQGRGFAVVAAEVRSLAQRTGAAAREIKTIIASNMTHVENCSVLANTAGSTMDGVVRAIHHVRDIVQEISAASAEQSTGVTQVGQAVGQMDQVTQQNAALVEQSAAAAASLQQQAEHLVQVVATFKLQPDLAQA